MAEDKSKYNILIELKSEVEGAKKAIDSLNNLQKESIQTQKDIKALDGQFLDSKEAITGFNMALGALAAGGFAALSSKALSCVQEFGLQERATAKLSAALKATGQDVGLALPALSQFANDMQRITNVADDTVLSMQSTATAMGVSSASMDSVIKGAIGLSKAFQMDLNTATKAASAAIQGKTELLTRYIPMLSECKSSEEKLAKVQEAQSIGFEMARSEAQDTIGSLENMKNSFSDLGEVIGEGVAPVVRLFANSASAMSQILQEYPVVVKLLTASFISLATSLAFARIGGLSGVKAGFEGIIKSLVGTKVAALGVAGALKTVGTSVLPIMAITTALGFLISAFEKASSARKEFRESMQKESNEEIERINSEIASINSLGLDSTAQSKYIENSKARQSEIDNEIEDLKKLKSYHQEYIISSTGAPIAIKVGDPQNAGIDAKIEGLKNLKQAYESNAKSIEENSKLLNLTAERNSEKNKVALAQATKKLSEAENELNEKFRAQKDAASALIYIKNQLSKNTKELADLDLQISQVKSADELNVLGERRLKILEQKNELQKRELSLTSELNKAESERKLSSLKSEELLKELNLQREILRSEAEGNLVHKESLEYLKEKSTLIDEYKKNAANNIRYAGKENELASDAIKYANDVLALRQKISSAKKLEAAANADAQLNQYNKELELLRLKANGDESAAKSLETELEKLRLIEDYKNRYKDCTIYAGNLQKLESDAVNYASERVRLESKITAEQAEQDRLKNRIADAESLIYRYKIAQAKIEGDMSAVKKYEDMLAAQREIATLVANGWDKTKAEQAVTKVRDAEAKAESKNGENQNSPSLSAGRTSSKASTRSIRESNSSFLGNSENERSIAPTPPKRTKIITKGMQDAAEKGIKYDPINNPYNKVPKRMATPNQLGKEIYKDAEELEKYGRAKPTNSGHNQEIQNVKPQAPTKPNSAQNRNQESSPSNIVGEIRSLGKSFDNSISKLKSAIEKQTYTLKNSEIERSS